MGPSSFLGEMWCLTKTSSAHSYSLALSVNGLASVADSCIGAPAVWLLSGRRHFHQIIQRCACDWACKFRRWRRVLLSQHACPENCALVGDNSRKMSPS
jgi:hypothetical protein